MNGLGNYVDFTADTFLANKAPPRDAFSPLGDYVAFTADNFLANKAPPRDAFSPLGNYDPVYAANNFLGAIEATSTVILRPKSGSIPGWPGFFGWLAATHPQLYNQARVMLPNVVEDRQGQPAAGSQLGFVTIDAGTQAASQGITDSTPQPTTTGSSQIINAITQLAAGLLPLYGQKKILDLQLQRAAAGQPPLDTSALSDPNAGINVGINKSTQNTFLVLAGAVLAGVLLLKLVKKR